MKNQSFNVAAVLSLAMLATQALAAPKPAAVAPVTVLAASPLDAVKNDYSDTALSVEKGLEVFLKTGESCGMIGTQMVSGLKEEKALPNQKKSRAQIVKMLDDAATGDNKKKALAVRRLDSEIAVLQAAAQKIEENIGAIQMGLDSSTPPCAKATKAFYAVRDSGHKMIEQLNKAKKNLKAPAKKASLAIEDRSPEAAYDQAAAQRDLDRELTQEAADHSEEPANATL